MFCRFCKSRGIVPVLVINSSVGSRIKTAYHCPKCGEELRITWKKREKEDR